MKTTRLSNTVVIVLDANHVEWWRKKDIIADAQLLSQRIFNTDSEAQDCYLKNVRFTTGHVPCSREAL